MIHYLDILLSFVISKAAPILHNVYNNNIILRKGRIFPMGNKAREAAWIDGWERGRRIIDCCVILCTYIYILCNYVFFPRDKCITCYEQKMHRETCQSMKTIIISKPPSLLIKLITNTQTRTLNIQIDISIKSKHSQT